MEKGGGGGKLGKGCGEEKAEKGGQVTEGGQGGLEKHQNTGQASKRESWMKQQGRERRGWCSFTFKYFVNSLFK